MYENILEQESCSLLADDIRAGMLPGAVLFAGPQASGKLSAGLETARILSCTGEEQGAWMCECPSCLRHKALVSGNLLLAGPRDCTLEIAAASAAFRSACMNSSLHLKSVRYLFLRSVRKLTMRFSPVLWQDDDKLSRITALTSEIDELMETIDFPRELPESDDVDKTCVKIYDLCVKLESSFLYDSIPVRQIRNISSWARMKTTDGKKTVIIENADRMLEGVRNALLKILEEPPEDTMFILLTSRRNAVMPTILSRVRTYSFTERSAQSQTEAVQRIFHNASFTGSIQEYLETYLPVKPDDIRSCAEDFFREIAAGKIPVASETVKTCGGFDPRMMLRIFLDGIASAQKKLMKTPVGAEASAQCMNALRSCWNSVTIYNQSPAAAVENLVRDMSKISRTNGSVFRTCL